VYESKVHSFVRLALFWEYKRIPLRRDDINKKGMSLFTLLLLLLLRSNQCLKSPPPSTYLRSPIVIEKATKHFKPIFYSTQRLLRSRFGMELVELRSKGLIGNSQALESGSQVQNTRNGATMKRKNGIGRKRRRGGVDGNNDDDNDDDDDDDDHDDDDTNGPYDSAAIPTTQIAREKGELTLFSQALVFGFGFLTHDHGKYEITDFFSFSISSSSYIRFPHIYTPINSPPIPPLPTHHRQTTPNVS
jgi:hypothetical protein